MSCFVSKANVNSFYSVAVFPNVPPAPGMPCQGEDSECVYCSLETSQPPPSRAASRLRSIYNMLTNAY